MGSGRRARQTTPESRAYASVGTRLFRKNIAASYILMRRIVAPRSKVTAQFPARVSPMRAQYATGSYRTSSGSSAAAKRHLPDLVAVCCVAAAGLSLTVIICALGYADSVAQALAIPG